MQTLQRPLFKNNYLFPIQIFLVDIQGQSSNVNKVIREVLNSLYFYYCFFLRKDFARTKSTKSTKTQPSKTTTRRTKSTMTQPSKGTKRYKRAVRVWWSH